MNQLKIYQKYYDMLQYLYIALRQFPKSEKFTLAAQIKNSAIKGFRTIIHANKSKNKISKLFELDIELEVLKNLTRLSKDLGFMPLRKYEILSNQLVEIGKMLGGWIKAEGRR